MSDSTTALAGFEDSRRQFVRAIEGVPAEALAYLAPGDDYSLGGLITHTNAVLRRYGRVLDAIVAAPDRVFDAAEIETDMARDNARSTEGLDAAGRDAGLAELASLHDHVVATLRTVGDEGWARKTPVLYGGATEPYPTGAADIVGWLSGHYVEHVPHVAELLAAWRAATPATQ